MYILNPTDEFLKKSKKLTKNNQVLKNRLKKAFKLLEQDPFYPSLKSHKITIKQGKSAFSSRVTGDIRILWNYQNGVAKIIDIIDIGGHEGKNKVYK